MKILPLLVGYGAESTRRFFALLRMKMGLWSLYVLFDEFDDAFYMKGDDGLFAFGGFKECQVGMAVHEEVFR